MEIAEIDKLTAGVINAPFDIVKKGEFKVGLVRWKHVVNNNSVFAHIPQNAKARKIMLILPLVSAVPLINFIKTFKVIQTSALSTIRIVLEFGFLKKKIVAGPACSCLPPPLNNN